MTQYFYLHGLASSPGSKKASDLRDRLGAAGLSLHVPDLNVPSFEEMRLTAQQSAVEGAIARACRDDEGVVLIGSSLGALPALRVASVHPGRVEQLVLLSPALGFVGDALARVAGTTLAGWREKGYLPIEHYDGRLHRLGYQLAQEAAAFDVDSVTLRCPAAIIHGTDDEVVPFENSVRWARNRPGIELIPIQGGDHGLLAHLDEVWEAIAGFVGVIPST